MSAIKKKGDDGSRLNHARRAVRFGNAADVLEDLQTWSDGVDEPRPDWDIVIGAAFWNRCVDKDCNHSDEEVTALERVYELLVQVFIRQAKDVGNYMDRLKVFGATFKFFIQKERVNLDNVEALLEEIARSSYHVRNGDFDSFKQVCENFYALIWNYMYVNKKQFDLEQLLSHTSLSVRWLVPLGPEQFQPISRKLSQVTSLIKNQTYLNSTIADFFTDLSTEIVELLEKIMLDDSTNGLKVKKSKSPPPASTFNGFLSLTFVFTRQLATFGDYDGALKVYSPITSITKLYFDSELTKVWKNVLEAYVKMCVVLASSSPPKMSKDGVLSSEQFREFREQIMDLNFQKRYPGYALSFLYRFTEGIAFAISNSSKGGGASLLKQLPISKCIDFLKELKLAVDGCVALDKMESAKDVLEGVGEAQKVEALSKVIFYVLEITSERLLEKDDEIDEDFQHLTEAAFSAPMALANRPMLDRAKSAELYNNLICYTCNMGYAYEKRKDLDESISWCHRSIDAYEALKKTGVEIVLKINILNVGVLLADCHRQLGNYKEGLRWLSKWLVIAPQFESQESSAYDIYEQIPWENWSVHWLAIQKEVGARNVEECKTVLNYLEEERGSISSAFSSRVLRLEMNAYFSGRQVIVPAILRVGQQLADLKYCEADAVIGLVCQVVGLWWEGTELTLCMALECIEEAIECLDRNLLSQEKAVGGEDETLRIYLSGIVAAWKGLCCLKLNQLIAHGQLDELKEKLLRENPDKLKDKTDGFYALPAFTSLTIEDEIKCATNFIEAAECFYQLSQMEESFKMIADTHCPAIAQLSVRLVAVILAGFGDKLNAAKAWYGFFTMAKMYDQKGLVVLAASELLKIFPSTSLDCVEYAEKMNQAALEANSIKHNKAVFYRLDLANSIACFQTKEYEKGLQHLLEVYTFLTEKDNFVSTHLLMAEADYVLSLYRSASNNCNFEFPAGFPEMLCKMTPAGLAVKGYKLLRGLPSETDVLSSGWTDLLHNYYLLGSMAELSSRAVKLLKETGKLGELMGFVADAVYFYQGLGFVSRSVAVLIPLIEMDISSRNFYAAQIRISAIAKVLLSGEYKEECESASDSEAKKFLNDLKISGLTIASLENVPELKWHLDENKTKPLHYRNPKAKYLSELKDYCESVDIQNTEMKAPPFLRHSLTCFCYTCSHPEIIPFCLEFLAAQAKYAVSISWEKSMEILELARLHHQRSMFRVLFNFEYVAGQMEPIVKGEMATALQALTCLYSEFFFKPGFQIQLAEMEISPKEDIIHQIELMKSALSATDIRDPQDYSLKALPLEIGTCAFFEYFVSSGKVRIAGSNIRDVLEEKMEQEEKENLKNHASPNKFKSTIPLLTNPPPTREK